LQERYDTFKRAAAFYDKQMLDHLNPLMKEYIARQEMAIIATADSHGECDASFRAGPAGFMRVLDDRTVMYPEYRGNGVLASLGNISENPHVGILFVDFFHSGVGLHVNGRARVLENDAVEAFAPILSRMAGVDSLWDEVEDKKKTPERWVVVEVVEAYIHCSKHIPLLRRDPDDTNRQSGDFFRAKYDPRPWLEPASAFAGQPLEQEPVFEAGSCNLVDASESESEPEPESEPSPVIAATPAGRALVAGPEVFLEDEPAPEADRDELEFLVPPPWGAYSS
jgi:predicted pyridoxine 5'-phosphate oxidase superfamily flavin-nucleotide-binding protein